MGVGMRDKRTSRESRRLWRVTSWWMGQRTMSSGHAHMGTLTLFDSVITAITPENGARHHHGVFLSRAIS
jgi:hypothetical protein